MGDEALEDGASLEITLQRLKLRQTIEKLKEQKMPSMQIRIKQAH